MECKNRQLGETLVVELGGRLNSDTVTAFEDHCRQSIGHALQDVVLDMGKLEYLSSAGLRSILTVAKRVKAIGGNVSICNATGLVHEILEVSGFLTIFPFVDPPVDLHHQHA
jgi:anti-sigma B factor antagonist